MFCACCETVCRRPLWRPASLTSSCTWRTCSRPRRLLPTGQSRETEICIPGQLQKRYLKDCSSSLVEGNEGSSGKLLYLRKVETIETVHERQPNLGLDKLYLVPKSSKTRIDFMQPKELQQKAFPIQQKYFFGVKCVLTYFESSIS